MKFISLIFVTFLAINNASAQSIPYDINDEKVHKLVLAIQKGDEPSIRSIVVSDFNSSLKKEGGIIMCCIDVKTALLLHQYGASYDDHDAYGSNLLMVAAQNGNLDLAKLALKNGVAINSKNFSGKTPLYYSVGNLHPEVADYFIKEGAYVDAQNSTGESVLARASVEGDLRLVELLLEHGADPLIRDCNKKLPIDYAKAAPRSYVAKEVYQQIEKLLSNKSEPTGQQ